METITVAPDNCRVLLCRRMVPDNKTELQRCRITYRIDPAGTGQNRLELEQR